MLRINNLFLLTITVMVASIVFTSCNEEKDCTERPSLSGIDEVKLDEQVQEIENYLDSIGVDYLSDPSGVRVELLSDGEGTFPDACSSVALTYTGTILRESEPFDSNIGTVFDLDRGNLIPGFTYGLFNMRRKGEYRLYIPSPLGYGSDTVKNSAGEVRIPPNSNLLFRIRINTVSSN